MGVLGGGARDLTRGLALSASGGGGLLDDVMGTSKGELDFFFRGGTTVAIGGLSGGLSGGCPLL